MNDEEREEILAKIESAKDQAAIFHETQARRLDDILAEAQAATKAAGSSASYALYACLFAGILLLMRACS